MKKRESERIEFINTDEVDQPLVDLSRGGLCCLFSGKKEKGEKVAIALGDLSIVGEVMYCRERSQGFRLGVRFTQVDEAQVEKLNELVETFSRGVPISCSISDV